MPSYPSKLEAVSRFIRPMIRPHVVPADFRERVSQMYYANPEANPEDVARILAAEIVPAPAAEAQSPSPRIET